MDPLDRHFKSLPDQVSVEDLPRQGWNLLDGDLLLPVLVAKESALANNVEAMAEYCRRNDLWLAPHAKTCMSPELAHLQLAAGAWGLTLATPTQVMTFRRLGVGRILLANELVEATAIRMIAAELERDPGFEFFCLVDSVAGVSLMEAALRSCGFSRQLRVLLEVGHRGGRTGCRSEADVQAVVEAVKASSHLELAGVEAFEGTIEGASTEARIEAVEAFLERVRSVVVGLVLSGAFAGVDRVLVSAGGSAMFDLVARHLGSFELPVPVRTILRSGCYLTHDSGMYEEISPLAGRRGSSEDLRLVAALQIWGTVLSRPEPELAILSFGKRDVGTDYRLPTPELAASGTRILRDLGERAAITKLNDQHAYLRIPPDDPLNVGDIVGCGISHPCTSFDKWRLILTVDDRYNVTGGLRTFF